MFDNPIQFAAYRLLLAAIVTAGAFGVALLVGIDPAKTALFTAAITLAALSLLAVKQIATAEKEVDAQRQLVIFLSLEFVFVPLAMAAATVGYLWDKFADRFIS